MRFFVRTLSLSVTFAFSFLIHFCNGQFELDTNAGDKSVPKIEHEETPAREMWFETSKGNNITLTCPQLPGSPPAVIEIHEPMSANPGLERKLVISTSGQLRLHNVTYGDAKTYYCSYFTEAARMPTAKIHLNVYDVFSYMHLLRRSRRSAAAAHKVDHSKKGHEFHGHEHRHEREHGHEQKYGQEHDHAKDTKAAVDHGKTDGKKKAKDSTFTVSDKNKTHDAKEEHNHEAAMAKQDEEKDANENYDGDPSADVIEPPSSPDVTQLSDNCIQLKWTSGSLRDRGVKGYKVEYLKGNLTKVFGGIHNWHTVANRVKPRFRIFKVNNLEPEMMYRFRIATIYAGNKYIYGLSSGWVKMQRWS